MSSKEDTKETLASSEDDGKGDKKSNANSLRDKENTANPMLEPKPIPTNPDQSQQESQQPAIRDFCIQRLLSGLTYVQLEAELKTYNIQISKSQLQRLLPKKTIDAIREQLKVKEQQRQTSIDYQTPNRNIPSAHLIIPQAWLSRYMETLPKAQRTTFQQMIDNVTTYNQNLEREAQQRLQGSQTFRSGNPSQDVIQAQARYRNAMAEAIETRTYERMMGSPKDNDGISTLYKAIEIVSRLSPKVQPSDRLNDYLIGRRDQKGEGKSGETNTMDLKLEELRQSHDIGMQKISWEQKLAIMKMENDRDKWTKIQETFSPILQTASPEIRNIIRQIGENVGKSLGGPGANPNPNALTSIECPKCKSGLNVRIPEGLEQIQVKCPTCENVFKIGKDQPEGSPEIRPKMSRLGYKSS